jgi:serine/threonine protein kinase
VLDSHPVRTHPVRVRDELQQLLRATYTIERELAPGGMGRVFLATDERLGRKVVIKVLPKELAASVGAERFRQETLVAARLRHPNLVPVLDAGEADGILYYTMPFIEGESLRTRLERDGRIPANDAIRLAIDVTEALAYAHAQGVIHRDIKPENILIDSGRAVVTDFGIARAVESLGGKTLTATGMGVGTPGYMSPEQLVGESTIDGRSDVYALGVVLGEMITGRRPQPLLGSTLPEELPDDLAGVLRRALEPNRETRFATATEFQRALAGLSMAGTRTITRTRVARRPLWLALAAVFVLAAAGGLALWFQPPLITRDVVLRRTPVSAVLKDAALMIPVKTRIEPEPFGNILVIKSRGRVSDVDFVETLVHQLDSTKALGGAKPRRVTVNFQGIPLVHAMSVLSDFGDHSFVFPGADSLMMVNASYLDQRWDVILFDLARRYDLRVDVDDLGIIAIRTRPR